VQRLPSTTRQPKLAPAPRATSIASISSRWSCPTSPIQSSDPSKANFHGLRNPDAQISGRPPCASAYGLSAGIAYGKGPSTSIRSILPRRLCGSCARLPGSLPLPPSPVPM
jgi:hypothetical protein